ncbi:hypothetical protein TNCV_1963131 [Trichonephila clavipes]|nr:hypothetical protein TNCV_1963131 [Trichonephila clavipes]
MIGKLKEERSLLVTVNATPRKTRDIPERMSSQKMPSLLEITAATYLGGIDSKRLWKRSWGTADQVASPRCQN